MTKKPNSDPVKAAKRLYELAHLENPPLRFVAGMDAIEVIRDQLEKVKLDVDRYESWSEGLEYV